MITRAARLHHSGVLAIIFSLALISGLAPASLAFAADTTPPTVVSVSPSGADAPAPSGKITIVFNEPMDTSMTYLENKGVITLGTDSGSSVTYGGETGHWINDTTFEIPYPYLGYSLTVKVVILFFRDAAGNMIETDASHSFTTIAAPAEQPDTSTPSTNTATDKPTHPSTGTTPAPKQSVGATVTPVHPSPQSGSTLPPTGDLSSAGLATFVDALFLGVTSASLMLHRRRQV